MSHKNCPSLALAGWEPPLAEMLADPLVHAVMARDNITPNDLDAIIKDARAKLRTRRPV